MKILSIQSAVAYGHVGNSAAVFPLQRIGVEVLPVYTVNFSNHTGYGAWRGPLISPADVAEVLTGIEERGVFPQIDAVLSGYQGSEGIGDVILDAVARVKAANPAAAVEVAESLGQAMELCAAEPFVVVTGSFYLVGEAMERLGVAPTPSEAERQLNDWGAPGCRAKTLSD